MSARQRLYTVSFTIEGGDESSYYVNGNPSPGNFTSGPIASATDFSFILYDANNCLPQLVQGNKNCNCFTSAGTMTNTSQLSRVCVNQSFTAAFNNNATLESDTLLLCYTPIPVRHWVLSWPFRIIPLFLFQLVLPSIPPTTFQP